MVDMFNVDCMEYMKTCSDNAFNLAIVDPPYGLPKRSAQWSGKLKNRKIQEMHIKGWDIPPDKNYFDELFKVSKNQIIWGGNYFYLPPNRGFIVWDKKQPWPNFSACEYAWNSIDGVSKMFVYDNRQDTKQHPTQKPIKLYEWLLDNYAKKGDRILDTHLGSGSSAIAAHRMGFDFVGCEIDKNYFQAAQRRFDMETRQQRFFQRYQK